MEQFVRRIESDFREALAAAGVKWIAPESSDNPAYSAFALSAAQQKESLDWLVQVYSQPSIVALVRFVLEQDAGQVAEITVEAIPGDQPGDLILVIMASRGPIEPWFSANRVYFQGFKTSTAQGSHECG